MSTYERVVCEDGFSMSVQAREFCYCTPRNDTGPYHSVEVGYPSEKEALLMPWAETPSEPTDTVYGWVPVGVIRQVIEAHGGMVGGTLPEFASEVNEERLDEARMELGYFYE